MGCYSNGAGLTICTGSDQRYLARTRWHGYRRYDSVGKWTRSYKVAVMRMAKAFVSDRAVKRADVLMIADYYEPVQICELRAR